MNDNLKKFFKEKCIEYQSTGRIYLRISTNKKPFDKNFPEIYKNLLEVTSFLSENVSYSERIFCVCNDIISVLRCQKCKKHLNYISFFFRIF